VGSPIAVGGAWAGGWENNDRGGGEQGAGVVGHPCYERSANGGSWSRGRVCGVGRWRAGRGSRWAAKLSAEEGWWVFEVWSATWSGVGGLEC